MAEIDNRDASTDVPSSPPSMETQAYVTYHSSPEDAVLEGKTRLFLYPETLVVDNLSGLSMTISLRKIAHVSMENYRIDLLLSDGSALTVAKLGYHYESFGHILARLRNTLLLTDYLIDDRLRLSVPAVFVQYHDPVFGIQLNSKCEMKVYETKLVLLTGDAAMIAIPFSLIQQSCFEALSVLITTDSGETLTLTKLGNMYDPFRKAFTEACSELHRKVTDWLITVTPELEPNTILKLSRLLPEGKAAAIRDLQQIAPSFWNELRHRIDSSPLREEFHFLTSCSVPEWTYVGFKRGLWGDWTGDYLWFLFPLKHPGTGQFQNCIAMETISLSEAGQRATYLFGLNESEATIASHSTDPETAVQQFIRSINQALLSINFRREPLYLSETQLNQPEYIKYRFAIDQLPALCYLRQLYLGRVTHSTPEKWQHGIETILNSYPKEV